MDDLHLKFVMIDRYNQIIYHNNIQFVYISENTDMFAFKTLDCVVMETE